MFYIILIIWLFLDFITKFLAVNFLEKQIPIIWDLLYFQLIYNPWISFWIEIPLSLLKIWTIVLIIWIFYYYRLELKEEKKESSFSKSSINYLSISFWLILAWAIWNWFERVFNEKVIDFIWVKYFSIFNLADSFITIWAIILIYYFYKKDEFLTKKNNNSRHMS